MLSGGGRNQAKVKVLPGPQGTFFKKITIMYSCGYSIVRKSSQDSKSGYTFLGKSPLAPVVGIIQGLPRRDDKIGGSALKIYIKIWNSDKISDRLCSHTSVKNTFKIKKPRGVSSESSFNTIGIIFFLSCASFIALFPLTYPKSPQIRKNFPSEYPVVVGSEAATLRTKVSNPSTDYIVGCVPQKTKIEEKLKILFKYILRIL